jgi:hypothetical protein
MSTERDHRTDPLEYHELANMFPMLDSMEVYTLAMDIREHGQREPIVLFEGKILDGRNRYVACQIACAKPIFKEYSGTDPISYVVSLNLAGGTLAPRSVRR